MKVIVPLNIAALRVNKNDASRVALDFKGRQANFNNMPYDPKQYRSSTGDAIIQSLDNNNSPLNILDAGIHLHWELPDYFKKGFQTADGQKIIFPQAPNRWLVIRYLNKYDKELKKWKPAKSHCWIIESDYISGIQACDADGKVRNSVPVPIESEGENGSKPYSYMGRILEAESWHKKTDGRYLNSYNDQSGTPYYLTAIGFVGPSFSSYYPECCSVFGFHDRFIDDSEIFDAITGNKPIMFKASYHVMGWIEGNDPMDGVSECIIQEYDEYVRNCKKIKRDIEKTLVDFFIDYAAKKLKWQFNTASIQSDIPEKTICNGICQEIVWDMLDNSTLSGFLKRPPTDDNIKLSIGNNSAEAFAALLKKDSSQFENYQHFLELLQNGGLSGIENRSNIIAYIEKELYSNSFSREQSGLLWIIRKKKQKDSSHEKIRFQPHLDQLLSELNSAQKDYDKGRQALSIIRKQLYSDWFRYIKLYSLRHKNEVNEKLLSNLIDFLISNKYGELNYVNEQSDEIGILSYSDVDQSGTIIVNKPAGKEGSKAFRVWDSYKKVVSEIRSYPNMEILAIADKPYWLPSDPVLAVELNNVDCSSRNGDFENLLVNTSLEIPDFGPSVYKQYTDIPNFDDNLPYKELNKLIVDAVNTIFGEDPELGVTCKNLQSDNVFMPLFITWKLRMETLKHNENNPYQYNNNIIRDVFVPNENTLSYTYKADRLPTDFVPVEFSGASLINKKTTGNITGRINDFLLNNPNDDSKEELLSIINEFKQRKIISQSLTGLCSGLLLKQYIPAIEIMNLPDGDKDLVTRKISSAMSRNSADNWYDHLPNNENPIYKGVPLTAFSPLRSGYINGVDLELIDVFGQRMKIQTPARTKDNWSLPVPSRLMSPEANDIQNENKTYFPPQIQFPTRLSFHWLRTSNNNHTCIQPEINPELSQSPVCGWILPDLLNNSLHFYNCNGEPIGSFSIENNNLKYRTRVENRENQNDNLEKDIGKQGNPIIEARLADFMWYIVDKSNLTGNKGGFFRDLIESITKSYNFIDSENILSDGSLALFVGKPLAVVGTSLRIETYGELLPINQVDLDKSSPWANDIQEKRTNYRQRMEKGSAYLQDVEIPVSIGELNDFGDGLIGYIIEQADGALSPNSTFFSPAAPITGNNGVEIPDNSTVILTLNDRPKFFTFIIEPSVSVHVATHLIPIDTIKIPKELYINDIKKIHVTFPVNSVLKQANQFCIPFSEIEGVERLWIGGGVDTDFELTNIDDQVKNSWNYSPQSIEEGWLKASLLNKNDENKNE